LSRARRWFDKWTVVLFINVSLSRHCTGLKIGLS
jgi:hypothetical protein